MLPVKSAVRSLCAVLLAVGGFTAACSGDVDDTVPGGGKKDSGSGATVGAGGSGIVGASGNSGTAGFSGSSGTSGAAGTGLGGTGGSGMGGTGGSGTDASVGGVGGMGPTCNEQFCPNLGMGRVCCVTPQGPCGMDYGQGCMGDPGGNPG
jgi:hypothetical protein